MEPRFLKFKDVWVNPAHIQSVSMHAKSEPSVPDSCTLVLISGESHKLSVEESREALAYLSRREVTAEDELDPIRAAQLSLLQQMAASLDRLATATRI
jgi:hypothetical protein